MILKLIGDAEKHFGKLKVSVWISKIKFKLLRPPYPLGDVAEALSLTIDEYLDIYVKVNEWIEREAELRGLVQPYDA